MQLGASVELLFNVRLWHWPQMKLGNEHTPAPAQSTDGKHFLSPNGLLPVLLQEKYGYFQLSAGRFILFNRIRRREGD